MPHPDEGLIHEWLDGELDAMEAARVEALVAGDPEWAAAAAEARGLIAASARIVGALDRVPSNVIPQAPAAPRRAGRPWIWRTAAAIVLVAGSAVVLERGGTNELPAVRAAREPVAGAPAPVVPPAAPTKPAGPPAAEPAAQQARTKEQAPPAPAAGNAITLSKKELDTTKAPEAAPSKDAVAASGEIRDRRADAANAPAVSAAGGASARSALQEQSAAKTTRMPASCWEQRLPADSSGRLIRFEPGVLDDSVRLERLTIRGDTIAAVHGRLTAVRVRCPAP